VVGLAVVGLVVVGLPVVGLAPVGLGVVGDTIREGSGVGTCVVGETVLLIIASIHIHPKALSPSKLLHSIIMMRVSLTLGSAPKCTTHKSVRFITVSRP
jgi:hypothetical protein